MQYIESAKQPDDGPCVFCALLDGLPGEPPRILHRATFAWITLAKFPYNPGHLLVLPVRHIGDVEDLTNEENAEIGSLVQKAVRALREESAPHGFNVGLNLGSVAGAGIPDHLHWHIVPRWSGDTNFMPVVGETRIVPELLADTFRRLAPRFER